MQAVKISLNKIDLCNAKIKQPTVTTANNITLHKNVYPITNFLDNNFKPEMVKR